MPSGVYKRERWMRSNTGSPILSPREKSAIVQLYYLHNLNYTDLGRLFDKCPETIKRVILAHREKGA